ncbi:MAG: general secretion pathway protein [Acinetobacter johnsonii]|uniref:General secretion pathway protein n=1 Tax=Acinetobacter johnsonii TaxID=40214 RepID=A0A2W5TMF5_ACIJO|nr:MULTISPECIES: type II secretion system protein N [Acinetobacter]MDH1726714.1 PDZ domain-containing protein [Acinetobacter johnsonii]MWC17328.1 PDZ domain-containing protein [Acinetobacter johnsonii]NWK59194.1 PDZ domain-containing protein [Acinetobacter sp. SwsAc2]PZQ92283.1 MAG: general secretion pathway protein [Acinetobacter johnsonii]UBQ37591.1 PDZ domain-containing protein [Acinetobacter johnsonii]
MGFDLQKLPELNLKQFERIAPLCLMLLILALCWKLAGLFWLWVAPPQVMQMPRVELGSQQPQVPNITNFALFAEQSKNPADDQLNLQLQGVVVGQPSQFSSAVIKANNVAERYRVGENIEGSAYYLSEVYWDRVILKNNSGQTRELFFQGIDNLDQQIVPPATAPVAAPAVSQEQQALGQAVQNLQQDREQYLKDLGVNTSNTGQGYQVTEQTPAALRSRLGLQAGDQIMSLNGQTIGQGQNDAQLLERARREGQVKIEVKRGDRIITVQQNFQ